MRRAGTAARVCRILLGAVLVLGAACSEDPSSEQAALVVDVPSGVSTWGLQSAPDEIVLIGTAPLRVLRPVTLEALSVETESGSLDLLEARVSMFACGNCPERPGLLGYRGYAGAACSRGPWPPTGYGPSYPVKGFEVGPGDRPSLVLYLRPGSPTAQSGAITLTYREDGKKREVRITNERISVEAPKAGTPPDDCENSMWFGSTKDPLLERVGPLSPVPSAPATP